MNILLLGSGGREHALAWTLAKSPACTTLTVAPGNAGIARDFRCVNIDVNNADSVVNYVLENQVDFVVIGPEAPLAAGVADALRAKTIQVFGPDAAAAQLETSKGFAKDFMNRHRIPTARYVRYLATQEQEALEACATWELPIVIKADGLAAGKGVTIATTRPEAEDAIKDIYSGKFGTPSVVIEEFMSGVEASLFVITDGERFILLPPAQDHKRIGEGDTGPNTGGMGAYAPTPFVSDEVERRSVEEIIIPTLQGMKKEGMPFCGCLYVGLMITPEGAPKVVEYNVRFGDPETQAVLPLMEGDMAALLYSSACGNLLHTAAWRTQAYSCTVVLASEGYPGAFTKGLPVTLPDILPEQTYIFFAGVEQHPETTTLVTSGGRVAAITALGTSLAEAQQKAYQVCDAIHFTGKTIRRDIAAKAL